MAKSEEISFTSAHEIKADRRILKTKKAIYEALVELMQKKKLNSITVTELAAQANINRKTFYTYYSTVNDVLDEGICELITSLKDLMYAMSEDYNMLSPQTLFAFLNTIMSDADIVRNLFASDNGILLFNRLQKTLQETLLKEMLDNDIKTYYESIWTSNTDPKHDSKYGVYIDIDVSDVTPMIEKQIKIDYSTRELSLIHISEPTRP